VAATHPSETMKENSKSVPASTTLTGALTGG
jgi:hypothetical protein